MSVIATYRKRKKWNQEVFSKEVGYSIATVRRWESKRICPTLIQARAICSVLRLPFEKLYNDYKEEE
jgi:DNA-binding XRE family transcriptional regulator